MKNVGETALSGRARVEDMLGEGDKLVARWSAKGTYNGDFMGMPPTGKPVYFTGIEIIRIEDGKAVGE